MPRSNAQAPIDPATDAALLLRRIGFATLALSLPLVSLVSRRAAVILVPIGVALMVIAALIENPAWLRNNLKDSLTSRAGLILLGLVGWAVLSLVWSPFTGSASEKAANLILAIALGFAGTAALPERMRSSNLNLVALGTGLAALFALILFIWTASREETGAVSSVERGISIVLIMAWPAVAWLLSRERGLSALGIGIVVGLLALTRFEDGEPVAMAFGLVAFGAVSASREAAVKVIAAMIALIMLLAPILPFLLGPLIGLTAGGSDDFSQALWVWADIVGREPVRLVTGHGLDTVLRGRITGALPPEAPTTLLFETWYELGIVGATAAAACLYFAIRAAGTMPGALAAGGVAAYVTAFALAAMGFATLQSWWTMTLAAVAILFIAIARGQYRTTRPIAPLGPRQTRPRPFLAGQQEPEV